MLVRALTSWFWIVLVALSAACGATRPPAHAPHSSTPPLSPGPLRTAAALAHDFQWHQRVTAVYSTGETSFEAALQNRAGALTLIGLSPMGLPGFIITLTADAQVTMENRSGTTLPFEPTYILADVQRVFFPWLPTPEAGFDGTREGASLGMHISETYQHGVLMQRSFSRDDAPDRGLVTIRYENWQIGDDAPARVVLDNGWFGYQLIIETVSQSRL